MQPILTRTDLVDIDQAAGLAGVSAAQLRRWAGFRYPKVIALHGPDGLHFPKWQFGPAQWPVVQQLAKALDGNAYAVLAWLETPHGAFDGRTPRAALEQGVSSERVLDVANHEGF
jgi:hypothetical protein